MSRIAVVIPARLASTRLPRKVLAELAGRPLIWWAWRIAAEAVTPARVWVATDSLEVAEAVQRFGGQVVLTREDHASGTDRVAEVAEGLDADIIVNLQADEPMLAPSAIEALARALDGDDTLPMATLVTPLRDARMLADPSRVKVVARRDGRALYFSRAPIPHARDGEQEVGALHHIGVYAYRQPFLRELGRLPVGRLEQVEKLEQLRVLENGHDIGLVEIEYTGWGIDTVDDLRDAREALLGSPLPTAP